MRFNTINIYAALFISFLLASCGGSSNNSSTPPVVAADPTPICVAVRGNGELIPAHFSSLARISEHFGPFEGMAGGSSGSITSFLTESLHMNPALTNCGGQACDAEEAGARLGLMYKSLFGYIAAVEETDLHITLTALVEVLKAGLAAGLDTDIDNGDLTIAGDKLLTILKDAGNLVNPEVIELLATTPDFPFHVLDIWNAIKSTTSFEAGNAIILLRPNIPNFAGITRMLGRIGSFYAGYGPYDAPAWQTFFDSCAVPGRGLTWDEVGVLPVSNGASCNQQLITMVENWRALYLPIEATIPSRLDDPIGAHLKILGITAVLTGRAAEDYDVARKNYFDAMPWTLNVNFADVEMGYWGNDTDTSAVTTNPQMYPDLKTAKAHSLGQSTWRTVLSISPAEPGLSRALTISPTEVSVGGWADLAPVLALKNTGCEHVVYVTRQGQESAFAQATAQLVGMSPDEQTQLFDLSNPDSSFTLSLQEAAGVWCTNWDAFSVFDDAEGLVLNAWNAPFEVHDPTLVPVFGPVASQTANTNLAGCTPGVL